MSDIALRLSIFLLIGTVAWWLAARFPNAHYERQRLDRFDLWVLPAMLLLSQAIYLPMEMLSSALLDHLRVWSVPFRHQVAGLGTVAQVLLYILAVDFLSYWTHRWMHSAALWRVHAFHHSPRTLNWFSGTRGSPVHFVFTVGPGAIMGALFLLTVSPATFYALFVLDVLSQHFTHSNVRLPFSRQLEWVFVTPRMHFVHHHTDPTFGNSNFGFYFSIWDHLFGTYTDERDIAEKGKLGLREDYTLPSLALGFQLKLSKEAETREKNQVNATTY